MAPSNSTDGAENPKPDWSKIFSEFACHTNITRTEIFEMPIPVIQAYRNNLGENIAIKIGMPGGMFGSSIDTSPAPVNTGKPPKLSEFMNFANAFN